MTKSIINHNDSLAASVLKDLKSKTKIRKFSVDEPALEKEYAAAEAIGEEQLVLDDIDFVVVLSGRSGFTGRYLECGTKFSFTPQAFDASDTARRLSYGISLAKKCSLDNYAKGLKKPVYVYFNGVEKQNLELAEILAKEGSFDNYPANLFIIDSIPLDSTLGNVIGLSKYLESYWPSFCSRYSLTRNPNLIVCTSTYHVPRVSLTIGANSPLLTPEFWQTHLELFNKLKPEMQAYVLNPGEILKNSTITILGCDRQLTAQPFWEKDLFGDMQARVNYSSTDLPSIAPKFASNINTFFQAMLRQALKREQCLLKQEGLLKQEEDKKPDNRNCI